MPYDPEVTPVPRQPPKARPQHFNTWSVVIPQVKAGEAESFKNESPRITTGPQSWLVVTPLPSLPELPLPQQRSWPLAAVAQLWELLTEIEVYVWFPTT